MTGGADSLARGDVFAELLGVWTEKELDHALPERPRGGKARWPMLGIFLLLWQWAFENRLRRFEKALPMLWPATRVIMRTYNKAMSTSPVSAELYLARWGIETDYRLFKGPNHLPVILSRTPTTVRQEILLRILAHNSVRFVQADACGRAAHDRFRGHRRGPSSRSLCHTSQVATTPCAKETPPAPCGPAFRHGCGTHPGGNHASRA